MPKQLTVVFYIQDDKEFKETKDMIFASFSSFNPKKPPSFGVCAVSNSDEIRRLELVEECLEHLGASAYGMADLRKILNEPVT